MPTAADLRLPPALIKTFERTKDAAALVLQRRMRVFRLVRGAYAKLSRNENALGAIGADLRLLIRLMLQWARGEYRLVPWKALVFVAAAVVYFVNPIDLIPDALIGIGFVDDAAVVAAVVRAVHGDLERFRAWEAARLLVPQGASLMPEDGLPR
jgi:uncharacterized membrane protein YkvA (DUF1232 family)